MSYNWFHWYSYLLLYQDHGMLMLYKYLGFLSPDLSISLTVAMTIGFGAAFFFLFIFSFHK